MRTALHRRGPNPATRPNPGHEIPPAHGQRRQASQLRAPPHRHHTADTAASCWNNQAPYELRDLDGNLVDNHQANQIITANYLVPEKICRARSTKTTNQRNEQSQHAPSPTREANGRRRNGLLISVRNSANSAHCERSRSAQVGYRLWLACSRTDILR